MRNGKVFLVSAVAFSVKVIIAIFIVCLLLRVAGALVGVFFFVLLCWAAIGGFACAIGDDKMCKNCYSPNPGKSGYCSMCVLEIIGDEGGWEGIIRDENK